MRLGYLVKYKRKSLVPFEQSREESNFPIKEILTDREMLVKLLQEKWNYLVFQACLVDVDQYRLRCPDVGVHFSDE